MTDEQDGESFADFKDSFSYGSRTDLNFKFLKGLTEEEAADFLQELLWSVADTIDDGDTDRLVDLIVEAQKRSYAGPTSWVYDDGPFAKSPKPVSQMKLVLITSTGHFVDGKDPKPFGVEDMTQEEAAERIGDFLKEEPVFTAIPSYAGESRLRVRHGGYDTRSVEMDPNVAFPLSRMRDLVADGRIGDLADNAYSFVGACSQMRLLRKSGPQWVDTWQGEGIEGAVLVPV